VGQDGLVNMLSEVMNSIEERESKNVVGGIKENRFPKPSADWPTFRRVACRRYTEAVGTDRIIRFYDPSANTALYLVVYSAFLRRCQPALSPVR
jgi:Phage integrase family